MKHIKIFKGNNYYFLWFNLDKFLKKFLQLIFKLREMMELMNKIKNVLKIINERGETGERMLNTLLTKNNSHFECIESIERLPQVTL